MKSLPTIRPIRPVLKPGPFDGPEWIFELKYDGFRGILYSDGDSCGIISKQGKRPQQFAGLQRKLGECLKGIEVILDGEVCSIDEKGMPRRNDLHSGKGSIVFVAFDILWFEGNDLRNLPLRDRKEILKRFAKKKTENLIQAASFIEDQGIALYGIAVKLGLEGIVAKRLDSVYSRSARWYKIKNPDYDSGVSPTRYRRS